MQSINTFMEELTVSSHFVKAALRGAEQRGFDPKELMEQAGISKDLHDQNRARVTGRQYTRLMQIIWRDLNDEYMGFAQTRSKPGTFATMCQLILHSDTLGAAFNRGYRFYDLFSPPISIALDTQGDSASLVIGIDGQLYDPDHFLIESLLVIWHRLACWLIGQRIKLDHATFCYPAPPHVAEYRHLFYCPMTFEAPRTAIHFHSKYLHHPIVRNEIELRQFLKKSPADLLGKPDDSNSYTAQIRKLIGKNLTEELPDFEWISSSLNLSPQTLRRRLKEESTSYQEIKDHMRRDLAIYHLSRKEFSINEIAHQVGFTEPSTFHRAFKKWTGVTPGAYRMGEREA